MSTTREATLMSFLVMRSWDKPDGGYTWNMVTSEAFPARDGAGILAHDGKMVVIGGWNPQDKAYYPLVTSNDVWSSSDGASWILEKPNTYLDDTFDPLSDWEGRHTAGYVVHEGHMWIVGGDANQGHYQNDVWSSVDGVTWELVNSDVPWGPRVLHTAASFNGKIYVISGQTMPIYVPSVPGEIYADVWSSVDGVTWERNDLVGPAPRGMIGGYVVFNDRLWLIGGGTYEWAGSPRQYFTDVWSTEDGVNWDLATDSAPWHPRSYHNVCVWDNKMWIIGGHHLNTGNLSDVWYSEDGIEWVEVATPWPARHAASVVAYDDALWVIAGSGPSGSIPRSDVWKLTKAA